MSSRKFSNAASHRKQKCEEGYFRNESTRRCNKQPSLRTACESNGNVDYESDEDSNRSPRRYSKHKIPEESEYETYMPRSEYSRQDPNFFGRIGSMVSSSVDSLSNYFSSREFSDPNAWVQRAVQQEYNYVRAPRYIPNIPNIPKRTSTQELQKRSYNENHK